jgi:Zn-dependent alcohol dehydrogenase
MGKMARFENRYALLTALRTAVSVGMAPSGSKVTLEPAMFMLQNKKFIGCTEGGSITYEVWLYYHHDY